MGSNFLNGLFYFLQVVVWIFPSMFELLHLLWDLCIQKSVGTFNFDISDFNG